MHNGYGIEKDKTNLIIFLIKDSNFQLIEKNCCCAIMAISCPQYLLKYSHPWKNDAFPGRRALGIGGRWALGVVTRQNLAT